MDPKQGYLAYLWVTLEYIKMNKVFTIIKDNKASIYFSYTH